MIFEPTLGKAVAQHFCRVDDKFIFNQTKIKTDNYIHLCFGVIHVLYKSGDGSLSPMYAIPKVRYPQGSISLILTWLNIIGVHL
jgi:hypothetical protein